MKHEPSEQRVILPLQRHKAAAFWHRGARLLPQWLAGVSRLMGYERTRRVAAYVMLVLGLAVQGVMILAACYLIDLAVALFDLWALLARKHLELTL